MSDSLVFYCRACCLAHYVEDCLTAWMAEGDEKNRNGAVIVLASLARDFELEVELSPAVITILDTEGIPLERECAIAGTA